MYRLKNIQASTTTSKTFLREPDKSLQITPFGGGGVGMCVVENPGKEMVSSNMIEELFQPQMGQFT